LVAARLTGASYFELAQTKFCQLPGSGDEIPNRYLKLSLDWLRGDSNSESAKDRFLQALGELIATHPFLR
jgi:hypothetical protein